MGKLVQVPASEGVCPVCKTEQTFKGSPAELEGKFVSCSSCEAPLFVENGELMPDAFDRWQRRLNLKRDPASKGRPIT